MKRLSKRQKTALITLPIAIGAMVAAWMLLPDRYFLFFLIGGCILVSLWEWYVGSRSENTRDSRLPPGPLELISSKGIVVKECGPGGTVRIWGELWNAKSLSGSRIEVGKTVIVRHVEGLLVFVDQLDDE